MSQWGRGRQNPPLRYRKGSSRPCCQSCWEVGGWCSRYFRICSALLWSKGSCFAWPFIRLAGPLHHSNPFFFPPRRSSSVRFMYWALRPVVLVMNGLWRGSADFSSFWAASSFDCTVIYLYISLLCLSYFLYFALHCHLLSFLLPVRGSRVSRIRRTLKYFLLSLPFLSYNSPPPPQCPLYRVFLAIFPREEACSGRSTPSSDIKGMSPLIRDNAVRDGKPAEL